MSLVPPRQKAVADGRATLARRMAAVLQNRRFTLVRLAEKVDALSPLSTLKRGYAVPLDSSGRVLRTAADFLPGETFQLRILNGRIEAETKNIQSDEVDRDE